MAYKVVKFTKFLLVLLIIIAGISYFNKVYAFDKWTSHPQLTEEIIKFYNSRAERKITTEELALIKAGSQNEDESPRWANHYFDAINNRGLVTDYLRGSPRLFSSWNSALSFSLPANPLKSIDWAKNEDLQLVYGANRTWSKAIRVYFDKKSEGLIALGSLLHLMEDLGVPEHARADGHIDVLQKFFHEVPSHYENYAKNIDIPSLNSANNLIKNNQKPYQYSNFEDIFKNLSAYTANNWFSEDTIGVKEFVNPKIFTTLTKTELKYRFIFNYNNKNRLISITIISRDPASDEDKIIYTTKSNDLSNQWLFTITPEIIKYGANLLNLYFAEIEKRQNDPTLLYIDRLQARDRRIKYIPNPVVYISGYTNGKLVLWKIADKYSNFVYFLKNIGKAPLKSQVLETANIQNIQTINTENTEQKTINQNPEPTEDVAYEESINSQTPSIISQLPADVNTIILKQDTNQDLESIIKNTELALSQTTTTNNNIIIIPQKSTYIFAGGSSDSQTAVSPQTPPVTTQTDECEAEKSKVFPKIIISEIQFETATNTKDEYIELYNPSNTAVNLDCFELKKHTSGGMESVLIPKSKFSSIIQPRGFFLISHPSVQAVYNSDFTYAESYSFSKNNSLTLFDPSGKISDLVGFGDNPSKIAQYETSPYTTSDVVYGALERMNLQDTDNNSTDFWLASSNPENTKSPPRSPRTDFYDLRNSRIENLTAVFDSEQSKIKIQFTEPQTGSGNLESGSGNYEYKILIATSSSLSPVSSFLLSDFGSSSTIPSPKFSSSTFILESEISKCPTTQNTYNVGVQLFDKLFSQNKSKLFYEALNLETFCNEPSQAKDHLGDDPTGSQSGKILISQIKISTSTKDKDEYLELYNPNPFSVSLINFSLIKTSSGGKDYTMFPSSKFKGVIKPFSFFLLSNGLSNTLAALGIIPDLNWARSYNLKKNNSIKLLDETGTTTDEVSWQNPENKALQRKAGVNSTTETMQSSDENNGEKLFGNSFDSDSDNDFVLIEPKPQNSEYRENPPDYPRNLNLTLNNATLTLNFVSPYQYIAGTTTYELRITTTTDNNFIKTNWENFAKINITLPIVRSGAYNEQIEFNACEKVKKDNWLILGIKKNNSILSFAKIQLTNSPNCPKPQNLTFSAKHSYFTIYDPVTYDVTIRNETENNQVYFPTGQNLPVFETTDYLKLTPGQSFSYKLRYIGGTRLPVFDTYTYQLLAVGINSDNSTTTLYSESYSEIGVPSQQDPRVVVFQIQIPENTIKLIVSFKSVKEPWRIDIFSELLEINIEQ